MKSKKKIKRYVKGLKADKAMYAKLFNTTEDIEEKQMAILAVTDVNKQIALLKWVLK